MDSPSYVQLLAYSRDELINYFKSLSTDSLKRRCGEVYVYRYVDYNLDYDQIYSLLSTMIIQRESDMTHKIKMNPTAYGFDKKSAKQL